jgi:murein DD-endopeptidase MepM/ murein hydrolase activator NlpD
MAKYVVKLGNTLSGIARDFGITVQDLQLWNEAEYPSLANNPNDIQIGWQLNTSPPVTATEPTSSPTNGDTGTSSSPTTATETVSEPSSPTVLVTPRDSVVIDTMYDAVNASAIPASAGYVAGYVDGPVSQWTSTDWDRFQNARLLTITVTGATANADVIDVENGDATVQTAIDWITRYPNRIIYINKSTFEANQTALSAIADKCRFWIADWTNIPHLYPGSIATQWTSGTIDQSLLRSDLLV